MCSSLVLACFSLLVLLIQNSECATLKCLLAIFLILYSVSQLFWQIAIAKRKCFMSPFKIRKHRSRLPLVGEIPYSRGNEEIVGGREPTGKRQQNRENVGECKGIESKLSNRQSG